MNTEQSRNPAEPSQKSILDPIDRISEVLFGLIMVLTFTGSLSAADAGRAEVRTMLIGAIGCNLAWGLIDGIMYLMGRLSEGAGLIRTLHAVRHAPDAKSSHLAIVDALPPIVASVLQPEELERVRQKIISHPERSFRPRLTRRDWLGALAVFLWVFVCTFPVVIPFVFVQDTLRAMRISNAIAIALLFLTGYFYGRCSELSPWRTGIVMVLLGAALVAITIALGG